VSQPSTRSDGARDQHVPRRPAAGVAAVFTALVGVLAFTGASHASADNGTPGWVAKGEFRKLRRGMTPSQVQRLFGTKGRTTFTSNYSGYRYVSREYRPCVGRPYSLTLTSRPILVSRCGLTASSPTGADADAHSLPQHRPHRGGVDHLLLSGWMNASGDPMISTPVVLGALVLAVAALTWAIGEHRRAEAARMIWATLGVGAFITVWLLDSFDLIVFPWERRGDPAPREGRRRQTLRRFDAANQAGAEGRCVQCALGMPHSEHDNVPVAKPPYYSNTTPAPNGAHIRRDAP
jgi:hypothetical protein